MTATLRKMHASINANRDIPIAYDFSLGDQRISLNEILGKTLKLTFTGDVYCIHCDRKTKKSFSQGYCYPCFRKLAQCDMCILKPETCHFDKGTCRDPEWAERHCMQNHTVYLSNSSALKVGITRNTQIPTRWIDQGAVQALPIFEVKTRLHSGLVEVLLANHVSDKTNWRVMLKGGAPMLDLEQERDRLVDACEADLEQLWEELEGFSLEPLNEEKPISLLYPVLEYPKKITSHNVEKNPVVEGTLLGIKGQYLILDNGVINIRKHTGYEAALEI
ncbi:MAG: DUF2797 domain-containing protein [Gammaproteobacteria bacterium]|nr:DUF2797 domain-containing protein [Gammaproteobacteria bacterium]